MSEALPTVGIIGPGRAGLGLALALRRAGVKVLGVHGRRRKKVPRGLPLSVGGAPPWMREARVVLLAVRDDSVAPLVAELVRERAVRRGQVVLHLSGALTADVLRPLRRRGAHIGSMHPLMTVSADPARAARHFHGAAFALEGDAAAVAAARRLARALGGEPVVIRGRDKARYHAGAVFASNYVVAILDAAQRLLVAAGFGERAARRALAPLTAASVANEAVHGPEASLTGPIMRGDAATIRRHLAALDLPTRELYATLGRATLALARRAGLGSAKAREVAAILKR
jgi:predicted short-subunit dehydrogenase-like oxidoreductase (DUF2520 family)